jgi:hypothetical protein
MPGRETAGADEATVHASRNLFSSHDCLGRSLGEKNVVR